MDTTGAFGSVVLLDWATVLTYASFLGFAFFGSLMRTMFGLYRGYTTVPGFSPERKRMAVEMIASTCFGVFAAVVLREIGVLKFAPPILALFAGLLGSDLMGLITKRLGISKGMNVVLSERQMKDAGLTDGQKRAMEYARIHGSIDNPAYRDINQTDHSAAKKGLRSLVEKGRLSVVGSNRGTRYVVSTDSEGPQRAVSGPPDSVAPKGHHKRPGGMRACLMGCLEGARRPSQVPKKHGLEN